MLAPYTRLINHEILFSIFSYGWAYIFMKNWKLSYTTLDSLSNKLPLSQHQRKWENKKKMENAIYIEDIWSLIIYSWSSSALLLQFFIACPTACFTACASIVSPCSSFYKSYSYTWMNILRIKINGRKYILLLIKDIVRDRQLMKTVLLLGLRIDTIYIYKCMTIN